MRLLLGAFSDAEWAEVYRKCFDGLKPGGYIEQVELDVRVMSDDGSLDLTRWGAPEPWTADEARVYVANVRDELKKPGLHIWHYTRRVWGRKP